MMGIFTYYCLFGLLFTAALFFTRSRVLHYSLLVLFNLMQWGLTIYEALHFDPAASGYFDADATALLMLMILSILCTTSTYHSIRYLKQHGGNPGRGHSIYYAAFALLVIAQTGAFLSRHIVGTWIFVELTTFAASMLIYHDRTEYSIEATWKYLFVCSIALAFAFIGILFLSISVQESGLTELTYNSLMAHAAAFNPFWLKFAFLFILIGYSAKMGLFPMHTVTVDAHTVAPPPISAFISTTLMNVGFVGIFRVYGIIAPTQILDWANLILIISGLLSVFVAVVYLLRVNHIKRMAAYSSLENMGIVALGLGVGGLGYYAAFLHILFHSFTKAGLFYQIQQIHSVYKSYLIKDMGGYYKRSAAGGAVLLFVFICLAAMPPSGMFVSEFFIFKAMFDGQHYILISILLFLLCFAVWALGKNFFGVIFGKGTPEATVEAKGIKTSDLISQIVLIALVIYLGFNPPEALSSLIHQATQHLVQ
jgi:hydrogenase-4 component F